MLIVMYKPNDSKSAVPDAQAKTFAENLLNEIPRSIKYVCISQMLVVDAIRAVMVEKGIDHNSVAFEVYNEQSELLEVVELNKNYCLSSWKSFREDLILFLKTIIKGNKV